MSGRFNNTTLLFNKDNSYCVFRNCNRIITSFVVNGTYSRKKAIRIFNKHIGKYNCEDYLFADPYKGIVSKYEEEDYYQEENNFNNTGSQSAWVFCVMEELN